MECVSVPETEDSPGNHLECFRCGAPATFMIPGRYVCPQHAMIEAATERHIPLLLRKRTAPPGEADG